MTGMKLPTLSGGTKHPAESIPSSGAPDEPDLLEAFVVHPDGTVLHEVRLEREWTHHGRNSHHLHEGGARRRYVIVRISWLGSAGNSDWSSG